MAALTLKRLDVDSMEMNMSILRASRPMWYVKEDLTFFRIYHLDRVFTTESYKVHSYITRRFNAIDITVFANCHVHTSLVVT